MIREKHVKRTSERRRWEEAEDRRAEKTVN